jgi:pyruvate dehydrogenase E2 component (dihydrolipoamide acetyltransferase)
MDDPPAVIVHPERNVAVAVETTQGLTIVVLREADRRSEMELAEVFQTMIERARAGRSEAADVEGATFTITNLGGLGIDGFTPIITPPQTGVLGIGAFRKLPAHDRPATLSLSFDHRVVDGAYAARFLGEVVDRIEDGVDGRRP